MNTVADALSRHNTEEAVAMAVSGPHFDFVDRLRQATSSDPALVALKDELTAGTRVQGAPLHPTGLAAAPGDDHCHPQRRPRGCSAHTSLALTRLPLAEPAQDGIGLCSRLHHLPEVQVRAPASSRSPATAARSYGGLG